MSGALVYLDVRVKTLGSNPVVAQAQQHPRARGKAGQSAREHAARDAERDEVPQPAEPDDTGKLRQRRRSPGEPREPEPIELGVGRDQVEHADHAAAPQNGAARCGRDS